MAKNDLSYWDDDMDSTFNPKEKKSKKDKKPKKPDDIKLKRYDQFDDDLGDCDERLPLSQEYLDRMANTLEQFLHMVKVFFIYPELSQDDYAAARKRVKKAISRMRKGITKDFDYDRVMEAIENGDISEKYIDGGY